MNVAVNASIFEERYEPGLGRSIALALGVHVFLGVVLLFGVRWQSRPPETVSVELWVPPPPVIERVEPPKPQPRVEPAPPPKPEPVIEKPDIALKEPPKPKPKPEAKPKPEPPKAEAKPKPEPAKLREDPAKRRMLEELAREQTALNVDRERAQIRDQLNRDANAAAIRGWVDKVRAKIRGNMVMPPEVKGNPEAVFDIVQLPTGEVLSARLRRSSGNAALDAAIERAILKSSPLPKADRAELFQRAFELKYRPQD